MINAVTPRERLEKVVMDGMCIGCGLCASLAGRDRISMETVQNGYQRPVARDPLNHELVDRIYDVCPATRLESLPTHLQGEGCAIDPVWGPISAMVRAHAADETTRIKAASGGVLTALAKFLLDQSEVAFIYHARQSEDDLTFGVPHISRTAADVMRGTSSIYGPTPILEIMNDVLDLGEPFGFIGKPCDISAVRNLARYDPRVNQLVKICMTPVCGGIVPPPQMDDFLARRQTDRDNLTRFAYRCDMCPGDTEFETRDGHKHTANFFEPYGGIAETSWQLPFRCKVCPDGPGEAADISAGDIWPNDLPDWETADEDKGSNAVLIRSAVGRKLFDAAVEAGVIVVEEDVSPRYYDTCQQHHVKKKQYMRARYDALLEAGRTVPRTVGLRLDSFAVDLGKETYHRQKSGTLSRLRSGKADELAPTARWDRNNND